MSTDHAEQAPRQLPSLEPETAFYWQAGEQGVLKICRCQSCRHYVHPPMPRCPKCLGDVRPVPVSGRGKVASYTINHQQWMPGIAVPFVFAAIELEEQDELYVMSTVSGCAIEAVKRGLPVQVGFEHHEDVWLPVFQAKEGSHDA